MPARKSHRCLFILVIWAFVIYSSALHADPTWVAVGWNGQFTHINPLSGPLPPTRSDLPLYLQALALSPSGTLYAGASGKICTIDPLTGDATLFRTIDSDIRGMAFSPTGELLITTLQSSSSDVLRKVNLENGAMADIGILRHGQGLDFSPQGQLYGIAPTNYTAGTFTLFTINSTNAQTQTVGSSSSVGTNQSLAFGTDGSLYALGGNQFARLDPTNGAVIGSVITLAGDYRGLEIIGETSPGTPTATPPGGTATPPPVPTSTPPPATICTQPLQRCGLGELSSAVYALNGRAVLVTAGGSASLIDAQTGGVVRVLRAPDHCAQAVAISKNGALVATGGGAEWSGPAFPSDIIIWDAYTGRAILRLPRHNDKVTGVAFRAGDTQLLSASLDRTAALWDLTTGQRIRTFSGHTDAIFGFAVSPDENTMATCSKDRSIILWDIQTGAARKTLIGHTDTVSAVAFSPNGQWLASGSFDSTIRTWDAQTGNSLFSIPEPTYVCGVVFSPDSRFLLTGSNLRSARLWDTTTWQKIREFSGHSEWCWAAGFSSDGSQAMTLSPFDYTVRLWDVATGQCVRVLSGFTAQVWDAAFTPDGTGVVSAHFDPTPRLWDARLGNCEQSFGGAQYDYLFFTIDVSPDGQYVLGGSRYDARLWNMSSCQLMGVYSHARSNDNDHILAAFSPDGSMVAISHDYEGESGTDVWNTLNFGAPVWHIPNASGHKPAFSSDGRYLLTGGNLYDVQTQQLFRRFPTTTSAAFAPDCASVAITNWRADNKVSLYDVQTGALLKEFAGHSDWIWSVAISPDNGHLLTASWDHSARLWDISTGQTVRTFCGHSSEVQCAAFSRDGSKILTAGSDGKILVWELSPPRAIVVAGGGNFAGNAIADQTNDLAAYAYKTLKRRGYGAADILYLSAFASAPGASVPPGEPAPWRDADGDGLNDVDGWATVEHLRGPLTGDFAKGAGRLLILMMDHGHRTQDFMTFRLSETRVLPSTTLDGWLDDLQTPTSSTQSTLAWTSPEVTLVVDSCYSGQIVHDCRLTTTELTSGTGWHGSAGHDPARLAGKKRIVIASTTKDKEAIFLPAPDMTSFMYSFLSSAYMGNSMGEAWRAGKRFFEEFPVSDQIPQLDDGTTPDSRAVTPATPSTARADKEFFGATWAYGVQSTQDVNDFFPALDSWTTHTLASPGGAVTLRAKMLFGQDPLQVVAVVRPPAPEVVSGEPVTNLPHLYLQRRSDTPSDPLYKEWQITTSTLFAAKGDYTVSFSVRFPYERVSNPVYGHVIVSEGLDPDQTPIHSILAVDNTANASLRSCFEYLGPYAHSIYLDRFKDESGYSHPDWIEYLINPFWDSDSDDWPTGANVLAAINNLPSDIGLLYVHLIGEAGAGSGSISLATGNSLSAAALDSALDALQARQTCLLVLVVDAPGSGAFLSACRATGSQQRAIFASGRATDAAYFLAWPTLTSFSQKLLGAAHQGNNLKTAFQSGGNFFNRFLRYYLTDRIHPQMDDNGDGEYNASLDGALARTLYLGRRYAFAGDEAAGLPFILDVTATQTVACGATATFTAHLIEGLEPTRVFAQVTERANGSATEAITAVSEFDLARDNPTGWTWSVAVAAPIEAGSYGVTVYAAYPDSPNDKLSEPAFSGLEVSLLIPTPTPTVTPEPTATLTPALTPTLTPTPGEPIRELIRSFYNLVLGREPEAGAVDAWHIGYFQYAVSFNIDVRFIPREMARLFFLSEEYAVRNRTNADFITDCYRVFLSRDPSQTELDNWLGGVWNRAQVMTVFSESEEFANRIAAMYPGLEGSPARNFVTFMYIGLLDRLVDKEGLEYAAGLFDAAFTSGGVEAVHAQAKQMAREVIVSAEFLGKNPTTSVYVTRFYRAFLGRFPSDTETAYWTGELDSGRRTTDSLIDLFADSAEFTARLEEHFGP